MPHRCIASGTTVPNDPALGTWIGRAAPDDPWKYAPLRRRDRDELRVGLNGRDRPRPLGLVGAAAW